MFYHDLSIRLFLYVKDGGMCYCSVDDFYELRQLLKALMSVCDEVSIHFRYGSIHHVRQFHQ